MNRFKWSYSHRILTCTLTLALISFADGLKPILAEPETEIHLSQFELPPDFQPLEFEPPNDGAPGDREDAGSRPFCPQSDTSFTALVPLTNLGFTAEEYPTFWLYVPYPSGAVEFILKDENTKDTVFQTQFQITDGPGIVGFHMPNTAPPLEIGKKYRWTFDFLCHLSTQSDVLSVNGVVLRAPLTSKLQHQLAISSPQQRVALFAQHGLWYETLTELAQLRLANPQDEELAATWSLLLQGPWVGLPEIAPAALLTPSNPQNLVFP